MTQISSVQSVCLHTYGGDWVKVFTEHIFINTHILICGRDKMKKKLIPFRHIVLYMYYYCHYYHHSCCVIAINGRRSMNEQQRASKERKMKEKPNNFFFYWCWSSRANGDCDKFPPANRPTSQMKIKMFTKSFKWEKS